MWNIFSKHTTANSPISLDETFKILTNASPDCIKLFDVNNKVLYMNPGGLREHRFKKLEAAQKTEASVDDEFATQKLKSDIQKMGSYLKKEIKKAKE